MSRPSTTSSLEKGSKDKAAGIHRQPRGPPNEMSEELLIRAGLRHRLRDGGRACRGSAPLQEGEVGGCDRGPRLRGAAVPTNGRGAVPPHTPPVLVQDPQGVHGRVGARIRSPLVPAPGGGVVLRHAIPFLVHPP